MRPIGAVISLLPTLVLGISGVALAQDGSIVAWGLNDYGQCNVPPPNQDFVIVVGAGSS